MKVIIQETDEVAELQHISVNDEFFDVVGWVNLRIGDGNVEVFALDLARALQPFLSKYYEEKEQI